MRVGFFRRIRRKRVIRLSEDLAFGVNKVMRERWDLLIIIEFYQNLDELESLLRKEKIVEESSRNKLIEDIEKIKRDYPFEKKSLPEWEINQFLKDMLGVASNIKQNLLIPPTDRELPSYHPLGRAWKLCDNFSTLEQHRRDIIEDEEKRITTFILVAVKKHIYYMQFFIDILLIVIGIIIGWLFAR